METPLDIVAKALSQQQLITSIKTDNWVWIPVQPIPAPRMNKSDVWRKRPCVMRYRDFRDRVRDIILKKEIEVPNAFAAFFCLPMPKSWSKKKRREKVWKKHDSKPDKNNLMKALEDTLKEEDKGVWCTLEFKLWTHEAGVLIIY